MNRVGCFCVFALLGSNLLAADDPLLTVGSLAPAFQPASYVQGEEISNFEEGIAYVVEFSGTNCLPCIAAIPHLEELKTKYKSVKFVTVFTEPADDVRRFLKGPGAKLTASVACDLKGKILRDWVSAAGLVGNPIIFVVGQDRRIAWIGHPLDIDGPLDQVAKGEPLDPMQRLRSTLEQHAQYLSKRVNERWTEAHRHNSKDITKLINEGKLIEAVEALDKAMFEYRDLKDVVKELRERKLFLLAGIPGRREEARSLALLVAADAYSQNQDLSGVASTLLSHYETAIPENRNEEFVHLAMILLQAFDETTDMYLVGRNAYDLKVLQGNYFSTLAHAHHLLNQKGEAIAAISKAISIDEELVLQLQDENADEWQINGRLRRLGEKKATLSEYELNSER